MGTYRKPQRGSGPRRRAYKRDPGKRAACTWTILGSDRSRPLVGQRRHVVLALVPGPGHGHQRSSRGNRSRRHRSTGARRCNPPATTPRTTLEEELAEIPGQIAAYRQEIENGRPPKARRERQEWQIREREQRLAGW